MCACARRSPAAWRSGRCPTSPCTWTRAESLVAEAARSHALAAGPGDGQTDALSRHLRPTSIVAAPLVAMGELQSVLVLTRTGEGQAFGPADVTKVAVFADFAARAAENALLFERIEALLAQAQIRESERADLSRRLVYAEQDERRKLSLHLHDGPLQTLSGVAMMLDAVAEDLTVQADPEPTVRVLETARARQRQVIRTLRELCFALEPWVLRDQGFVSAMEALADEFESGHSLDHLARHRSCRRARARRPGVPLPDRSRGGHQRGQARPGDHASTSSSSGAPGRRLPRARSPTTARDSPTGPTTACPTTASRR